MIYSSTLRLTCSRFIPLIGFMVAVSLLLTGFVGPQAGAAQHKKEKKYSDTILEIKFTDESDIEAKGNTFVGTGADEVNTILGKAKIQKNKHLFTKPKKELKQEYNTLKRQGKHVADLSQYYQVKIAADADIDAVSKQLEALAVVEHAYPQPLPVASPTSPSFVNNQTYRQAAPTGTDANSAASWPGATGSRVKVVDIEYSWNLTHEDMSKARISALIPNGSFDDPFDDTNHGTATLGVITADANSYGVTGLAKDAALGVVNAYTTDGYAGANAIDLARANMTPGDVLLIEQAIDGPAAGTADTVPLEWIPSIYDAILTATAQNIIVVEPAGNGNQNLDNSSLFGAPFPEGKSNSGALMVGAGGACSNGTTPRNSRMSFSTYGSRVDIQGNGECVVTTGGWNGTIYSAGGVNAYYTGSFNGTSSASAIIAGTAAAFSSAYEQLNGVAPTPAQVRSILQTTGTAQKFGTGTLSGNIGPLPNLAKALPYTDLIPPTAPTLTRITLSTWYRKPVLQWTAATDNVGIASYKIYRNNVAIVTVAPSTSYTDNSAPRGTHQYSVSAIDKAGRESPRGNPITIMVP